MKNMENQTKIKKKSTWKASNVLQFGHNTGTHCDLEIRTQGGWNIKAHSFVLATASKFLKKCLEETLPGKTPVIYLPEVKPSVIQSILTLIYTGVVTLSPEDTEDFYWTAEMLQIEIVNEFVSENASFSNEISNFDDYSGNFEVNEVNFDETQFIESSDGGHSVFMHEAPEIVEEIVDKSCDFRTKVNKKKKYVKKGQSIVTPDNHLFFKTKLLDALQRLYNTYNVDIDTIDHRIAIEISENPPWIKSKLKCAFCATIFRLSARLSVDKKSFIQWRVCPLKSHITNKHGESPTLPLNPQIPIKQEKPFINVKNFEEHEMETISNDDDDDDIIYESEQLPPNSFDQVNDSRAEHFPGSVEISKANAPELKKRLIRAIKSMLKICNVSTELQNQEQNIEFSITEDPPNTYGKYQCCICKKFVRIQISYRPDGRFRQWNTTCLKKHIEKHGV